MPDRHIAYEDIDGLKPFASNAKDHDIGLLISSIERFGFISPVLVDERSEQIVAGHGRVEALKQIRGDGGQPPDGVKVVNGAWQIPVVRGIDFDDDSERRAYILSDNRVTEMGGWHEELLLDELKRLAESEVPLEGTGYDLDDLDRMLEDAAFADAPPLPEPSPAAAPPLSDRFGVRVDAKTLDAENELVDLLTEHGYEAKRLSE